MLLEKVIFSDFRNYVKEEISFSPKINYIQGDNAEGKSNLLEAIYLVSTGKSFRTHQLQQLVRHGQKRLQIEAYFSKGGISHQLTLSFGSDGRKIRYNQTSYTSFLPLLGILPCVLVAPEDISILTGSPSERRRFLDLHIAQIDPLYVYHLGRYHKAMKQRNALLKKQQEAGLDPWEQIMSLSASYLLEKRKQTLDLLQPAIEKTISFLSETKETFSWTYENSLSSSHSLDISFFWKQNRKKDLLMGTTLAGPHRDDVSLAINGQEAKTYCSEGQKRSLMVALRLAEWKRFDEFFEMPPLFAVDDFGVHLDEKRNSLLNQYLGHLGQVFLTAPSFFEENKPEEARLFHIHQGNISYQSPSESTCFK